MMNEFLILMRFEWVITLLIFILLFIKLGRGIRNTTLLTTVYFILLLSIGVGFVGEAEGLLFGGMFGSTRILVLQKTILLLASLFLLMVHQDWLKKHEHLPEFLMLMFSSLLGMFLMISSRNLLLFYLGLELSTIPIAAMANFDLHKRTSSESAMKMILSSAFSSGILLFGISLLYGFSGSLNFETVGRSLNGATAVEVLAFIMFFSGLAFKLSVVPFHLWTADVYQGAPVAVTAFLSVVSKGSIAFILMTLLYKVFPRISEIALQTMMILALLTVLIGNLFALRQTNLKRFMAFSSIAQVGFILVGMMAGGPIAISAVTYFVLIYVFSNLAAFGVISIVSEATGKESIDEYKGFYQNNKLLSWVMAIALFSLAGIPPTAGFFGKLFLILAGASQTPVWFIGLMALNLVISLYYYLKVVRAMFMDTTEQPLATIKINGIPRTGLIIATILVVVVGMIGWLYEHIMTLSTYLIR